MYECPYVDKDVCRKLKKSHVCNMKGDADLCDEISPTQKLESLEKQAQPWDTQPVADSVLLIVPSRWGESFLRDQWNECFSKKI